MHPNDQKWKNIRSTTIPVAGTGAPMLAESEFQLNFIFVISVKLALCRHLTVSLA